VSEIEDRLAEILGRELARCDWESFAIDGGMWRKSESAFARAYCDEYRRLSEEERGRG
jgi:hypothetical protein